METHAASAKRIHCMKIVIVNFLIVTQQKRETITPGAKNVGNVSKQVWTTMETPTVCAKDSHQPNPAIFTVDGTRALHSSQTALQRCQLVPGVINAINVGRLNCKKALRQDVGTTPTSGGQKLGCVPQTSTTSRTGPA